MNHRDLRQAMLPARRWLTTDEAAAYCGVARSTFEEELKAHLPETRITTRPVFDVRDIDALLESRKAGAVL